MKLARVLGAIGRGLISAGVIVLLFVAYQLWGTGLQHAAAQGDLDSDFIESTGIDVSSDADDLAAAARASQVAFEEGQILAEDTTSDPAETEAPAEAEDEDEDEPLNEDDTIITRPAADLFENNFNESERQEILAKLYPEAGEAFARINIPAINVDQITVAGVSVEDLRKGPGHYQTTANPGQAGNAAIAGHRTTYGAPFHRVDELEPGDPIFVTTAQGVFEYRVLGFPDPAGGEEEVGYFIVSPSDTWVLDQKPGQNLLTLTACHPKYSARQRIIVQAELVGEPAPTIPRDEAVELGEVSLDSGAADERAGAADGVDGDSEIPEEERQIISDAVAADDDPSVDADGNPIDADTDDVAAAAADDDAVAGDAGADPEAGDAEASDAGADAEAGDPEAGDVEAGDAEAGDVDDVTVEDIDLASAQTPFNTDDFGEGLNGDPTKVKPAILWGIAGLFVWIASWFMGSQLERKWTLYAIGMVPFVLTLWSTFVNVDQALPSY